MPTITVYLTNDLYDKVRDAPSKTVRAALEYYFKNEKRPEQTSARAGQVGSVPCDNASATENE